MTFDFPALGTHFWIEVWDEVTEEQAGKIFDFARFFVSTFEERYSRFKSDSLISTLNRERTFENPSEEFVQLLQYSKQLYLRTNEVFNPLTGHILEARGYDANYSFSDSGASKLAPGNPITDIIITTERIELLHGNVDLGGYGKGYLIDLLASTLKAELQLEQFLINGGGDIFVTNRGGKAVTIHLEDPTKPGTMIGSTTLHNQGFAASSPHKRAWKTTTGTTSHIIADQLYADATYIKATTAADADAFATTALQLDPQQLERLAKSEQLGIALFTANTSSLIANRLF